MSTNYLLKIMTMLGRVCVPIDIDKCEEFDPKSPPTVPDLVKELNDYDAKHPTERGSKLQGT